MGLKLFDGSDSENDDLSKIEIDREYARRFEHNKKREDLHRLQELKKKGLVESSSESSSSSDEEDEDFANSSARDREFFEALIKVKKQDPVIKNKDLKLFEEDEKEMDDGKDTKEKKKKAMYLKDVVAKQLIEEGPEFEDEEGEEEGERKKSYVEEQEVIKRELLEAVAAEDGGDGDLFKIKEKNEEDDDEENESGENSEFVRKLDEYFGGDAEVDRDTKFLKDFFKNKMWEEKEGKGMEIGEEELEQLREDEEEIEKQEEFEYRYQENAGDRVMGHARKLEGTVRKKTNARKEQRKSKEERMEAARLEREEELKHLKNLKKEEMDEKVRRILRTAGIREDDVVPLSQKELEEEFKPEEYDRMMKKAFGAEYYDEEDVDPEFGSNRDEDEGNIEKPDFEEEDELLGLPKGWDDESGSVDGFLAARERILKRKKNNGVGSDQGEAEEDQEEEESKRKRKRKKSALLEKAKEAMMDEYYKLDYEDTIGELKTRFKYAKTKPNRFGLNPAELLIMDENELNQYISLKKLAPYRENEWKLSDAKRQKLKERTKDLLWSAKADDQKDGKKKRRKDNADKSTDGKKKRWKDNAEKSTSSRSAVEDGKAEFKELNGDASNLSRKARRRRNLAEVKLSHSRLMAYGKIPSKSRSKAKH
jgi:protein KRI1